MTDPAAPAGPAGPADPPKPSKPPRATIRDHSLSISLMTIAVAAIMLGGLIRYDLMTRDKISLADLLWLHGDSGLLILAGIVFGGLSLLSMVMVDIMARQRGRPGPA